MLGSSSVWATRHDRRGGKNDPVRDDPVLDVDRRERDEDDAEARRDHRVARSTPKARKQAATRSAVSELDGGVAERDPRGAVAAAATQEQPRDDRDVVVRVISWPQLMQAEAGATIDRRSGTREATTLRKLPTARPGRATAKASALTPLVSADQTTWLRKSAAPSSPNTPRSGSLARG